MTPKLKAYQDNEIAYIMQNKSTINEAVLRCILDTHYTMVRLDYLIEENEKIAAKYQQETAHGHGGNDNIPQPDESMGILSPITRVVNETIEQDSNNTDHPNTAL